MQFPRIDGPAVRMTNRGAIIKRPPSTAVARSLSFRPDERLRPCADAAGPVCYRRRQSALEQGMADKKVVVAGATGLVGNAALRHFGASGGCDVVALSRRKPRDLYGARHVQIDLTDAAECQRTATELQGATHLVYAALFEAPNLIDG